MDHSKCTKNWSRKRTFFIRGLVWEWAEVVKSIHLQGQQREFGII